MIKRNYFFLLLVFLFQNSFSQQIPRFNPDTVLTVNIDSAINIHSTRLDVEAFIHEIVTDTSFYKAFRSMKQYNFVGENQIFTYDKSNRITGRIYRKFLRSEERTDKIKYLIKQDSGKIYKRNGKYQLYTLEMFDYIFMHAYQSDFTSAEISSGKDAGDNGSYKEKLKTLIFSPGRPVKGIPFISNKTEIFSANMRQYYDYHFYSGTYLDSIPVYRFKVTVKPDLSNWTKDGLMIKELTTIFDKRNMQILGRYINMKYSNMLFDFNVQMNIELSYFGPDETLLPTKISYQGDWNVPFKKQERASFLILQKGYEKAK